MEDEAIGRSSKVEVGICMEGSYIFHVAVDLGIEGSLVLVFEGIVGIVGNRTNVVAVVLDVAFYKKEDVVVDAVVVVLVVVVVDVDVQAMV